LQRLLPDRSLRIVVRGVKEDPGDPTVEAQGDLFSFGIPSRSAASPSARKPPIFFKKSDSPSGATRQSNRSVRDGKTPDVAGWSKLPPLE
jgi:hypothetical protein